MWFSIWSSLIVITDEGRNPETGWLRSYLVYTVYMYKTNIWFEIADTKYIGNFLNYSSGFVVIEHFLQEKIDKLKC